MARCVISKTETEEAGSDRRHDRLDLGRHHRCAGDDRPFGLGVAQQRAKSDFQILADYTQSPTRVLGTAAH